MLIKMQLRCVVAMQLKRSIYNKLALIEHRFKVVMNRLRSIIVLLSKTWLLY